MTNTERFGANLESAALEIDNAASTYTQGLKQFGSAQKELGYLLFHLNFFCVTMIFL